MLKKKKTIIIGLSGGIASGKTTVARLFKKSGAKVIIDADKITHRILNAPQTKKKVVTCFGKKVLNKSGQINRCYLGNLCFRNKRNIIKLNKLVHPLIRKEINNQLKKLHHGIIILDVALLIEKELDRICDYLIFVDVPYKIRQQRIIKKRKWNQEAIKQRERFQMPLRIKKDKADFTIYNNNDLSDTRQQVSHILKRILKGEKR